MQTSWSLVHSVETILLCAVATNVLQLAPANLEPRNASIS
eukprot:SAG31_NODE_42647_length_270_cov_1.187135_1_plen_39_part_10